MVDASGDGIIDEHNALNVSLKLFPCHSVWSTSYTKARG